MMQIFNPMKTVAKMLKTMGFFSNSHKRDHTVHARCNENFSINFVTTACPSIKIFRMILPQHYILFPGFLQLWRLLGMMDDKVPTCFKLLLPAYLVMEATLGEIWQYHLHYSKNHFSNCPDNLELMAYCHRRLEQVKSTYTFFGHSTFVKVPD